MRDLRFVTEHRGGPLARPKHGALMVWALNCVSHAMKNFTVHPVLSHALELGKLWADDKASVGDARNAALTCHSLARSIDDPAEQDMARACGHALATTHMADHCLQAARYAVRAVQEKSGTGDKELSWQASQATNEIRELVEIYGPVA